MVWALNDLVNKNWTWKEEIPGLEDIVDQFDIKTRKFGARHFTVGGDAARWKAPPAFNAVRDRVRDLLAFRGISSDDGEALFETLTVCGEGNWHAASTDQNRIAMASFLFKVGDTLRATSLPPATIQAIQEFDYISPGVPGSYLRIPPPGRVILHDAQSKAQVEAGERSPAAPVVPTDPIMEGHHAGQHDFGHYEEEDKRQIAFSKNLTWLLRHGAAKADLKIRYDGYALIDDVLNVLKRDRGWKNATHMDVHNAVYNSPKMRFQLWVPKQQGDIPSLPTHIRCPQGHSSKSGVDDESLFGKPWDQDNLPHHVIYHGTKLGHLGNITKLGLVPGGLSKDRNHIHFTPYHPKDERCCSGMRFDSEIILRVDVIAAVEAGVRFYSGAAGAVLSPDRVPSDAIFLAEDYKSGAKIWSRQEQGGEQSGSEDEAVVLGQPVAPTAQVNPNFSPTAKLMGYLIFKAGGWSGHLGT